MQNTKLFLGCGEDNLLELQKGQKKVETDFIMKFETVKIEKFLRYVMEMVHRFLLSTEQRGRSVLSTHPRSAISPVKLE